MQGNGLKNSRMRELLLHTTVFSFIMAVHPVKSSPCTLLAKTDPHSYPLKTPPLIHPSPQKRAKNHPNPQAISGDSSL